MIDEQDIARLKEIFVTRQECNSSIDEVNRKLANDSIELALIKQSLHTIDWVSKTTLGAVIATIVGVVIKAIVG